VHYYFGVCFGGVSLERTSASACAACSHKEAIRGRQNHSGSVERLPMVAVFRFGSLVAICQSCLPAVVPFVRGCRRGIRLDVDRCGAAFSTMAAGPGMAFWQLDQGITSRCGCMRGTDVFAPGRVVSPSSAPNRTCTQTRCAILSRVGSEPLSLEPLHAMVAALNTECLEYGAVRVGAGRCRRDRSRQPSEAPHKCRFTIYALDLPSMDDAGTPMTWRKLRFIINGHILAQASLMGLRGHS
jgi:hypothetical protein